jgi:integrase
VGTSKTRRGRREKGNIETLQSGALRVRVYAGIDPVSKRAHYLRAVIPADTPNAWKAAEAKRTELLNQVNEKRHPRTRATVNQLLDKYFATIDVADITRETHVSYAAKHVRPFIGEQQAGAIDADVLDSLYAELRRCRDHCDGRRRIVKHRVEGKHKCDERCRRHVCVPLAPATVRKIHFIISGAFSAGMRWRWVSRNPAGDAAPPAAPPSNPSPPTAAEAAKILESAWADPDWGSHVWLAMTTGARRGELCAVRWRDVDLPKELLRLYGSKTGKDRRVALDPTSVAVLGEQRQRYENRVAQLGSAPRDDAFVFSKLPDHSMPLDPRSVTPRYKRMVTKLGIDSHLHTLRHYSATELIAGGVDVRSLAGSGMPTRRQR